MPSVDEMNSLDENKINHLILDTGAFISTPFDTLRCMANNLYTVQGVLDEIRDKATRQRLKSLPPFWTQIEPSQEDIEFIIEFSKKTGDYAHLSATDIKILALTAQLQRTHVSSDFKNRTPNRGEVITRGKGNPIANLAGFYDEKKSSNKEKSSNTVTDEENKDETKQLHDTNENEIKEKDVSSAEEEEEEEEESNDDSEKSDDSEGEWITPKNVGRVKKQMANLNFDEEESHQKPKVACVTVDFAMQNVLLQLGLPVVSAIEGRIIKRCSQFILRCHACTKLCTNLNAKFCPSCGNLGTMKKVCVTTDSEGNKKIHINFKRPINIRGKKYSMPMPKGGKHSTDPIVVADQPIPQMRAAKAAVKEKKLLAATILDDPSYSLRSNPFSMNDVTSRASRFRYLPGTKATQLAGLGRNPNAVQKSRHKK